MKLRLPIGCFAFGHNPLTFWLPKRGPQLIGRSEVIQLSPGGDDVPGLKNILKQAYDRMFEECMEIWNGESEGKVQRKVTRDEWDFCIS